MSRARMAELRQDTVDMFYHGYDNYMAVAFPEDELRPISCQPLTRDSQDPTNIGLNDVLGNYSLTLIDSLSTLALLATSTSPFKGQRAASRHFQEGIAALVEQYGDGSDAARGEGLRARGFDVDSKVQVFETVIRGVGGLLSAHLFALGELPARGQDGRGQKVREPSRLPIRSGWSKSYVYDGQLLRLAHDLGRRLLPAFYTPTGIPYPRVNLRHGIPYYLNSPFNQMGDDGQCTKPKTSSAEVTETCSAGAGSLVLEFTTLSRLTGDARFEKLAKRAFWEVWKRRSSIGLIGAGIDAESGLWSGPITGVGAGIDSFFEYALKSHILLSGSVPASSWPQPTNRTFRTDPNLMHRPLTLDEDSPTAFLTTWQISHSAIKRHLYRDHLHPHYINVHLNTGAPQALWIDSLGAYYPGLLTLSGDLAEAASTHLLYTALWTRYSALPERWSTHDQVIEGGLGWWPGRPEFIESTYHLFRATSDPFYLHVGEMVLGDITRRCRTPCGWAGLQDVRSGQLTDRMESFFLGETAKYLFLLFDPTHPLNRLDAAFVFTTEGHPLVIPTSSASKARSAPDGGSHETCPRPPPLLPFSISPVAARSDLFHASFLAKLHLIPTVESIESPSEHAEKNSESNIHHPSLYPSLAAISPSNYTYYPYTLPQYLIPPNATSSLLRERVHFEITFPASPTPPSGTILNNPSAQQLSFSRVPGGMVVNNLAGLRIGMVPEETRQARDVYRVFSVGGFLLGRDEQVYIKADLVPEADGEEQHNFERIHDDGVVELVVDRAVVVAAEHAATTAAEQDSEAGAPTPDTAISKSEPKSIDQPVLGRPASNEERANKEASSLLASILQQLHALTQTNLPRDDSPRPPPDVIQTIIRGTAAKGPGATPPNQLPELFRTDDQPPLERIHIADHQLCHTPLPAHIPQTHHVLVIPRGGCSYAQKLAHIPHYRPSPTSLRLVVVVSEPDERGSTNDNDNANANANVNANNNDVDESQTRPLLEEAQRTPSGKKRKHPLPLVLVHCGHAVAREVFGTAKNVVLRPRWRVTSGGVLVSNVVVVP